ncbi:MAG: hypothetical protein N2654_00810 [Deltaproteobacteria bacterium]|nr:hypothetical protein [Deltaproteobacteria bacterium]
MRFGTDGVRFNLETDQFSVEKLNRFCMSIAEYLIAKGGRNIRVALAHDTRSSCEAIKHLIVSNLLFLGIDVDDLGVMSTGILGAVIPKLGYNFGIVVSASHNPSHYNGIKLFDEKGFKLSKEDEAVIEQIFEEKSIVFKAGKFGSYRKKDGLNIAVNFVLSLFQDINLSGKKIVLDCANGSHSLLAERIFKELGGKVTSIGNQPNGANINETGCIQPSRWVEVVRVMAPDLAFCFDGDGDRCYSATNAGRILDGDYSLAILSYCRDKIFSKDIKGVVATVASNSALEELVNRLGLQFKRAPVGDRNVFQEMIKSKFLLGGEQSGHTIIGELNFLADGLVTALLLSKLTMLLNNDLTELASCFNPYPQKIFNYPLKLKTDFYEEYELSTLLETLKKQGVKVLPRYSGTEPLLRLIIEARDESSIFDAEKKLSSVLKRLNIIE